MSLVGNQGHPHVFYVIKGGILCQDGSRAVVNSYNRFGVVDGILALLYLQTLGYNSLFVDTASETV